MTYLGKDPVGITSGAAFPIDDTAGEGDTTKVWSADKTCTEVSSVRIKETVSTPADIMTIEDGADNILVYELVIGIGPVQSGSGDPAPDNVRPISGWTGVNVTRTGFNLFNKSTAETGKTFDASGYVKSGSYVASDFILVKPNTEYYITYGVNSNSGRMAFTYDVNKNMVAQCFPSPYSSSATSGKITTDSKAAYIRICVTDADKANFSFYDTSKNGTYEPYSGSTYSITFPSQAGTVYGGTLTVNQDGSGELVVDRKGFTVSDLVWNKYPVQNGNAFVANTVYGYPQPNAYSSRVICSEYQEDNSVSNAYYAIDKRYKYGGSYFGNRMITVIDNSYSTAAEFQTAKANTQFIVPLETPQTYTLTASQITTLLGPNHIFADTGAIQSLTYSADPKLYVDQHIPAVPVQDVQVNGTSVVMDGVANVPIATNNTPGVTKASGSYGFDVVNGYLSLHDAESFEIKDGLRSHRPISTNLQHQAAFYGLAKVAGADEKNSTLPAGQYTETAKSAIKKMLGFGYHNYELIKMVTATEDTQQLIIDTDEASNSFSLKGFLLLIQSVAASSATREHYLKAALNSNFHGTNRIMDSPSGIRKSGARSYALFGTCFEGLGYFVSGIYSDMRIFDLQGNIAGTIYQSTAVPQAFSNQTEIHSVLVASDTSTDLIGAGSIVALYGIKA